MVLLWLLSTLYERLPEVGDLAQPKLVLVFDEAHLLVDGAPAALLERLEQVVRLILSKGVSLWFCTQNPMDLPPKLLGQLAHRVQHALRAYTPAEQKLLRAVADGFRPRPGLDVTAAIGELAVGEALVSFLDDQGAPIPVERAWVLPPASRVGALPSEQRRALIEASPLRAVYAEAEDRESAYELLRRRAEEGVRLEETRQQESKERKEQERAAAQAARQAERQAERQQRERDRLLLTMAGEVGQAFGGRRGRSIARGVLGSMLGRSR